MELSVTHLSIRGIPFTARYPSMYGAGGHSRYYMEIVAAHIARVGTSISSKSH